ncbi:hypothetical protein [Sorangium sp. So ce131]|uniref:hypothetical protein n=1 Tax=Sorangium sp. So ce131 TaxID=3133282 RepID=UPI003F63C54B
MGRALGLDLTDPLIAACFFDGVRAADEFAAEEEERAAARSEPPGCAIVQNERPLLSGALLSERGEKPRYLP